MKTLILCILLTVDFGLFIKPGTIVDNQNKIQYILECEDTSKCYFDLSLNNGVYLYLSKDKQDTVTFIVSNGDEVNYLGEQNKDLQIIK